MSDEPILTGLADLTVTAPVTEPEPVPVAAVPAAPVAPAVPLPDDWDIHRVAALVRDLATNMYDECFTIKKHGLSPEQYAVLKENDYFKRAVEVGSMEWHSPLSTPKRLAMGAAIALEDALPTIASRLKKPNENLTGIVELAKLFAKMAGVGETTAAAPPSEKFKITINLGADVDRFEKQVLTIQQQPEGPHENTPLQQFLAAPGSPTAVPAFPKGH